MLMPFYSKLNLDMYNIYNMFIKFIQYCSTLGLLQINLIRTNTVIVIFNTKTVLYTNIIMSAQIATQITHIELINKLYSKLTVNLLNNKILSNILPTLAMFIPYTNKKLNKAALVYVQFFWQYANYLNFNNKVFQFYIFYNTNFLNFKKFLKFNLIYDYKITNISQIFINNYFKPITLYIIVTLISLFFIIYSTNVVRLSILWFLNISIYIISLLIFYFISNILKVSKKIYILLYYILLLYLFNLFLYNEVIIEYINIISLSIVIIFIYLIIYFYFKYNLFFLIFLELSIIAGKWLYYVFKQYCRDILNIAAYLLRIFLLFIRLNIYDGLDDFFDSYYIFIGDFNDYDYFEIIYFYSYNFISMTYDNLYDKSILNYVETEFYFNIIYMYTFILFKFLLLLLFLVEGVLRLLLASYIFILVLIEINNFNVIFIEKKN